MAVISQNLWCHILFHKRFHKCIWCNTGKSEGIGLGFTRDVTEDEVSQVTSYICMRYHWWHVNVGDTWRITGVVTSVYISLVTSHCRRHVHVSWRIRLNVYHHICRSLSQYVFDYKAVDYSTTDGVLSHSGLHSSVVLPGGCCACMTRSAADHTNQSAGRHGDAAVECLRRALQQREGWRHLLDMYRVRARDVRNEVNVARRNHQHSCCQATIACIALLCALEYCGLWRIWKYE